MTQLSPGILATEVDYSAFVKSISTSTFGLVGIFQKGPVGAPTLVTSLADALAQFGTYLDGHFGMFALKNFFENGGQSAYVVRTAHYVSGVSQAAQSTIALVDRAGTPLPTLTVKAATPGTWGDTVSVTISDSVADPTSAFNITVLSGGVVVETFKDMYIGAANVALTDYVEKRVNGVSAFIVVTDLASASSAPTNRPAVATSALASGNDGLASLATTDFIGDQTLQSGLFGLDTVAVNFVAISGEGSSDAAAAALGIALISYVEGRGDCVAILEAPSGKSAQQLSDFRMSPNSGSAFNSSFAALYGPWITASHPVTGRDVLLPPSGFVAGIFARNDTQGAVWTAPAGPQRGVILGAKAPGIQFSKAARDVLYAANVNPIAQISGVFQVYGQKTLQLKGSATDRLNVRREMCYLEKAISDSASFLLFETNDSVTWNKFKRLVGPFLQRIKDARGLTDFAVICDETLNTPSVIDSNTMKARVLVKPPKAAEFIPIEFAIAPTDADLTNL